MILLVSVPVQLFCSLSRSSGLAASGLGRVALLSAGRIALLCTGRIALLDSLGNYLGSDFGLGSSGLSVTTAANHCNSGQNNYERENLLHTFNFY